MLKDNLKKWFGFDEFKEGQEEIIDSVLHGKHTLGILPTGSGKSLCYQLPTYIRKPTLIISPLIYGSSMQRRNTCCMYPFGMDEVETILND